MERRKFLIGMGSLAAGGAAAMGTGAFTSVQAQRGLDVQVAGDGSAYLQLNAPDSLENGEYATGPGGNENQQLTLDFDGEATTEGGSGVNADAMNRFDEVFTVTNMGTQTVNLFIKDQGNGATLNDEQADRIRFYYEQNGGRKTLEDGDPDGDAKGASKTPLQLGAGNSKNVGVEIDTTDMSGSSSIDTPQELVDGTIIVYATA